MGSTWLRGLEKPHSEQVKPILQCQVQSCSNHSRETKKKSVFPHQFLDIAIAVFIDFYMLSACLWTPKWQESCLLQSLWTSHWITTSPAEDTLSGETLSATTCCWLWQTDLLSSINIHNDIGRSRNTAWPKRSIPLQLIPNHKFIINK